MANWFNDMVRDLFMSLDSMIYGFIETLLQLVFDISMIDSLISSDVINDFISRLYLVLGIYMVFRISFVLINAIFNPDSFTDKKEGGGKFITRTIASLVVLVMFPFLYSYTFRIQMAIMPALPQLIMGRDFGFSENIPSLDTSGDIANNDLEIAATVDVSEMGKIIGWEVFRAFYIPASDCSDAEYTFNTIEAAQAMVNQRCETNTEIYKYQYTWLLSTVAGIAVIFVLLGFALDIAVRVFKLTLLRIIAPIPIISFIDAKSKIFPTFIKMFLSTFMDLFLKLGALYVMIFFMSTFIGDDAFNTTIATAYNNDSTRTSFVMVFLIIGLFFFAKGAPKFLKDIFGIKDNPGNGMFGGVGKIANLAATGLGAATGARANYKAARTQGHGVLRTGLSTLGGALGGVGTGLATTLGSKDNKIGESYANIAKRNAGIRKNALDFNKGQVDAAKSSFDALKQYKAIIDEESNNSGTAFTADKFGFSNYTINTKTGKLEGNSKTMKLNYGRLNTAMKATDDNGYFNYRDSTGNYKMNINDFEPSVMAEISKSQAKTYMQSTADKEGAQNPKISGAYQAVVSANSNPTVRKTINTPGPTEYGDIGLAIGQATSEMTRHRGRGTYAARK